VSRIKKLKIRIKNPAKSKRESSEPTITAVVSLSDRLVHYDKIRQDLRDEAKMRITQRDNLSIQCFIVLGTLLVGALTSSFYYILLLMPLITIYYTTQILYSYFIYDMICYFLREKVEKKIVELIGKNDEGVLLFEWENFTAHNRKVSNVKVIGIRRNFFVVIMWVISFGAQLIAAFLHYRTSGISMRSAVLFGVVFVLYFVAKIIITHRFVIKTKGRRFE